MNPTDAPVTDSGPAARRGATPAGRHRDDAPPPGPADRVVAWIDRDHPRVGRFFLGLRWGGLRTVEPTPATFAAVLGGGSVAAAALARRLVVRGRRLVPAPLAAPLGAGAAWGLVWRWDARRWRHRHVRLVPGLAPDDVRALADRLVADGVPVGVWERRGAGGTVVGLSCRTHDLRRVNREVGAAAGGEGPGGPGGTPAGTSD